MSTFRTVIKLEKPNFTIDYNSNLLFVGSCFTESIGNILAKHLFKIQMNPFGIIYNPISISKSLEFILDPKIFQKSDLNYYNEKWFSFYHHGKFSDSNIDLCLHNINSEIQNTHNFLKNVDYIFLTLGTAKVYRNIETNEIVANCHKFPSKNFTSEIISIEEIVKQYSELIQKLKVFNQKIKIIFTVSPIRHWSDGAILNQISKSTLLLAINNLVSKNENIYYFPVYEIFMDELRDYRFYADDMLHPNETSIKYVWSKFSELFFDIQTNDILKKVESLIKAQEHRPFNAKSIEYSKFIENQLLNISEIHKINSQINLEEIKQKLLNKIL